MGQIDVRFPPLNLPQKFVFILSSQQFAQKRGFFVFIDRREFYFLFKKIRTFFQAKLFLVAAARGLNPIAAQTNGS